MNITPMPSRTAPVSTPTPQPSDTLRHSLYTTMTGLQSEILDLALQTAKGSLPPTTAFDGVTRHACDAMRELAPFSVPTAMQLAKVGDALHTAADQGAGKYPGSIVENVRNSTVAAAYLLERTIYDFLHTPVSTT